MFEGESTKLSTIGCRASAPILVYMKLKALGIYRVSLHALRSQGKYSSLHPPTVPSVSLKALGFIHAASSVETGPRVTQGLGVSEDGG